MVLADIISRIDHTCLSPGATLEKIKSVCTEAIQFGFAAVCIPPCFVPQADEIVQASPVKVATVIGFPMGYSNSLIKVEEAKRAMLEGAAELDVVINLSFLFSGNEREVLKEIQSITQLAHLKNKSVKWIIECGLLSTEQVERCCSLAVKAEVDYVKTSTGFHGTGATAAQVSLLRQLLPAQIKIKASGGIRTREQAEELILAGADRIGTSSSLIIAGKLPVEV